MNLISLSFLKKLTEYTFYTALFLLPFSIAGMEIFFIISFSSFYLYKAFSREPICENQKFFLVLSLLVFSSSVSAFYSGYPQDSLKGILKMVRYCNIIFVSMWLFRDQVKINKLFKILIVSFSLVLLDCVVQHITSKDPVNQFLVHYTFPDIRLTGPYKFYGLLAAHLLAMLPILFSAVFYEKNTTGKVNVKFVISLLVFTLGVYMLYKTKSRGAWLAGVGGWIVFGALLRNKWVFIILLLMAVSAPVILPRYSIIHEDIEKKEQSLRERYQLWRRAVQVIEKRPLFGCGINTYVQNYPKYDEKKHWRVPGYYAHNGYLQLAAETGLISLVLFLWILLMALKSGYKKYRTAPDNEKIFIAALLSAFAALLIQAISDTTLHNVQSGVIIWFYIGLLMALGQNKAARS